MKDVNCELQHTIKNQSDFGRPRIKIKEANITFPDKDLRLDISKVRISIFDLKKGIGLPTLLTPSLAEEIGIHLGDGFLSSKRYEYRLKGHKIDEKWYYIDYLKYLYKRLYNLDVNIKDYSDTIGFEVSSLALWEFKVKVLGIKPGRKDNLVVPEIIKVNDEEILCAFLRGFFDTDGSIAFLYKSGKGNYYPCITITQKSHKIIEEVAEILTMLGFSPRFYRNRQETQLMLNGYAQFKYYEDKIGWNSPKHLNKIIRWKEMFIGGHSSTARIKDCG